MSVLFCFILVSLSCFVFSCASALKKEGMEREASAPVSFEADLASFLPLDLSCTLSDFLTVR